ncbi:MAG: FAD binding domain-containing protein [Treponema sp.]|nr:FAD binding domain-containing protein [Treponema sp.]
MEDQNNIPHNQVFSPFNLAELFTFWNRFPDSVLFAGGTDLLRGQTGRIFSLPKNLISLDKVEELKKYSRTERHLELGAALCLSDIIRLGKIVPEALVTIINAIGNPRIRNLATIGGAIMSTHRYSDLHAVLIALDATYELKSAASSRWISASKFVTAGADLLQEEKALISRIRIPLTSWNYIFHKKIGDLHRDDPEGGTFLFLCNVMKNTITEIHLIFVGSVIVRFKDVETNLVGQNIPLGNKNMETILANCSALLEEKLSNNQFLQKSLYRCIETALTF